MTSIFNHLTSIRKNIPPVFGPPWDPILGPPFVQNIYMLDHFIWTYLNMFDHFICTYLKLFDHVMFCTFINKIGRIGFVQNIWAMFWSSPLNIQKIIVQIGIWTNLQVVQILELYKTEIVLTKVFEQNTDYLNIIFEQFCGDSYKNFEHLFNDLNIL